MPPHDDFGPLPPGTPIYADYQPLSEVWAAHALLNLADGVEPDDGVPEEQRRAACAYALARTHWDSEHAHGQ